MAPLGEDYCIGLSCWAAHERHEEQPPRLRESPSPLHSPPVPSAEMLLFSQNLLLKGRSTEAVSVMSTRGTQ